MGDNLSIIESHIKTLEETESCISNIMQSPQWKLKVADLNTQPTDLVLPLFPYSDDFEPNDALGPHSEK